MLSPAHSAILILLCYSENKVLCMVSYFLDKVGSTSYEIIQIIWAPTELSELDQGFLLIFPEADTETGEDRSLNDPPHF